MDFPLESCVAKMYTRIKTTILTHTFFNLTPHQNDQICNHFQDFNPLSANLNLNYKLFIKKHIKKTLIISHVLSIKGMGHRWGLDMSNIIGVRF